MKAVLRTHYKFSFQGLIIEAKLYEVEVTKKYPLGVKYRIICIDPKTKRKILLDNHHPKGPHIHIDDEELRHEYKNEDQLLNDFEHLVFVHMGVKL